tara:strand:+ start:37012 stop:37113 length:102 start_codon:yes stop_codon:yes gene_type:complete
MQSRKEKSAMSMLPDDEAEGKNRMPRHDMVIMF